MTKEPICWCDKDDEPPQIHHTDACNARLLVVVEDHEIDLDRFSSEGNPHGD